MKYNREETLNHILAQSYPEFIYDFNRLIEKEDNELNSAPSYFTDIDVINLDLIEKEIANNERRGRNKTMDCAFVIDNNESNTEILLIELRFNYKNLSNLNKSELEGKVSGSINITGTSIPIHDKKLFVFKSGLVQQAINRLQRMNPRIPNNYSAVDLNYILSTFF